MNILMIHPHDIYSKTEPWTVRVVYMAKEFIIKGHSVKLLYFPVNGDKQGAANKIEEIDIIPLSRKHGPRVLISNIIKVYKLAKDADIIHFQKCFYHAALPAIITAILKNKPIHYDWDDWELKIYEVSTEPGALRSLIWHFLNLLERTIPRIVDTVSCASNRLKVECQKLGVKSDRIFDAHVGADVERFNPNISGKAVRQRHAIDKPLVLYLGQLHGGQYVKTFIEVAAKLINDYKKDASFMIVGDGYQARELKKIADSLNLDGNLIFAGAVLHEEVPEYIAAADVCVACFEENEVTLCKSPLKVVEYLASGKPIVASNVGEVPNMIGKAGILTKPGDVSSLAEGILEALRNKELRHELGQLARKRAEEEYNWTVTSENILRAYKKSIEIKNTR